MAAKPSRPGTVTNLTASVSKPGSTYDLATSWNTSTNTTSYQAAVKNSAGTVLDSTTVSVPGWTAHVSAPAGSTVKVSVTPLNGRRKGATTTISVPLADLTAPTATYTSSWSGFTGTLTESGLADDSGLAGISRTIDWGDSSPAEDWATGTTATHTYGAKGVYYPTVTLKDAAGNSRVVNATNMIINDTTAPTGTFTVSPIVAWTKLTAVTVTQTALGDDMSDPANLTRVVDWGDGTAPQAWTTGLTFAHTYAVAGSFTPVVMLADESGNQTQVTTVAVTAKADTTAPVVKLVLPTKRVKFVRTWSVLKGKASDSHGTGVKWVKVRAVEKRGLRWFGYRPATKTWVKTRTQSAAFRASRAATVHPDSLHRWKATLSGLKLGTLVYHVQASDRSGNLSKVLSHQVKISRS